MNILSRYREVASFQQLRSYLQEHGGVAKGWLEYTIDQYFGEAYGGAEEREDKGQFVLDPGEHGNVYFEPKHEDSELYRREHIDEERLSLDSFKAFVRSRRDLPN